MATAQEVRTTLDELLQTIDPNTATERKIREQVADKLGDISEHKKLIRTAIDDYLTEQLKGGATATAANDAEEPSGSPKPKRQRTAAAAAATTGTSNEGAPEGGIMLDTQGLKWVSVSKFKGQQYVNIRNYFRAKDTGALGPTKKGISLNPTVWSTLQAALPQLKTAVDDGNEDFAVQLTDMIKATVNTYQGKLQVDIREYYEDGGQLKPGIKGIALLPEQYDALVEAAPKLTSQLDSNKSNAPAAAAAGANKSAAAGDGKPAAAAAAAAGGGGGKKGGGSGSGPVVDLGNKKRAAISDFGGGGVDLRETYEKDGQMLPGKKGILLKPAQWSTVCAAADDITKALEMRNMKYQLDLGNKRSVQLSEFKHQYYVAIREYYEKDGKLLPGQKGLNMTGDQWYKLVDGMAQINEHLK